MTTPVEACSRYALDLVVTEDKVRKLS